MVGALLKKASKMFQFDVLAIADKARLASARYVVIIAA
jgi:hypothetical protein